MQNLRENINERKYMVLPNMRNRPKSKMMESQNAIGEQGNEVRNEERNEKSN